MNNSYPKTVDFGVIRSWIVRKKLSEPTIVPLSRPNSESVVWRESVIEVSLNVKTVFYKC